MAAGINPQYMAKFTPGIQRWMKKAQGVKFVKEFVWNHGQHCYIFGTTGSGKTQRSYWFVNWLMHTENIIWISSGKSDEILPLFTLGKKVRIIIPKGAELQITGPVPAPYEIVEVSSPREAWGEAKGHSWTKSGNMVYDTITVFDFRNTISDRDGTRSLWMQELFRELADGSRLSTLPKKLFPCSIFLDEAQWLVTGRRISQKDGKRFVTSEIITENVLEMRSYGCRFVLCSQAYMNIPPALRENLTCSLLCRGADVSRVEHSNLGYHCHVYPGPAMFKSDEAKFIYPDNSSYPNICKLSETGRPRNVWRFPLYSSPAGCAVVYGKPYSPAKPKKEEPFRDQFPEDIGIYNPLVEKPDPEPILSRWGAQDFLHKKLM